MKKIFIILLLIPFIIGLFIYLYFFKIDHSGCGEKGMEIRVGSGWQPIYQYCVTEYSDGGKACSSSDECQGNCVVNDEKTKAFCQFDNDRSCERSSFGSRIEVCPLNDPKPCIKECDIQ